MQLRCNWLVCGFYPYHAGMLVGVGGLILSCALLVLSCNLSSSSNDQRIVINDDLDEPSSPLDLVLTAFSNAKLATITVKIRKREGYPSERFEARNTSVLLTLSDGFEFIDGQLMWQGDLIGNDTAEFKAKVQAVREGEWKIEAEAKTHNFPGYLLVKDSEILYVFVTNNKMSFSAQPFKEVKPRDTPFPRK